MLINYLPFKAYSLKAPPLTKNKRQRKTAMNKSEMMTIMILFRYADDLIICFRYEGDAVRVRRALTKRLEKYRLKLNEDKTNMVKFSKTAQRKGQKQEAFNFLGFTFYLGKSLSGVTIPKLKTEGQRFRTKLQRIKRWFKEKRSEIPTVALWKTFCAKLRGHVQYYGVSHNCGRVEEFVAQARRIAFKWLNM